MRRDPSGMRTEGATHLAPTFAPLGFKFRVVRTGESSGGQFCEAEFARPDRRVKLHFRHALGMVRWHIGDISASHGAYMQALGQGATYPRSQDDEMDAFRCLARDFSLIRTDFIEGDGGVLARAAVAEDTRDATRIRELMAGYVGDTASRSQAREALRSEDYAEVVRLLSGLSNPEAMTRAEKKMYTLALKRVSPGQQVDADGPCFAVPLIGHRAGPPPDCCGCEPLE